MTISPEQLTAWKRLADEATSGPWDSYFETGLNPMVVTYTENEKGLRSLKDAVVHGRSIADNNFIAAARTAVPALIEEVERYRKVELFQEKWTGDNYAKQLEETAKIVEENDRLRKQLALCKEQRDRMCYNQLTDDERKLFFADKVLNKMDAEIEAIK